MKTITIITVLVCCILMFFVKRKYKIAILMLSTICFTVVKLNLPLTVANSILAMCFVISELPHIKSLFKEAKGTIVWKLMGVAILMTILTIAFSPHLRTFNDIRYFVQGSLFFKYFGLIYSFWCFQSEDSIKPSLRITFVGLLVLTFFGIVNYITKSADFVTIMEAGWMDDSTSKLDIGDSYLLTDRFRVMAMFVNPFDYGYICIMIFLLHLYASVKKYEKKTVFLVVLFCTFFGIISCGCRTIILCTIIGVSVFFLLAYKTRKSIRILLLALFLVPITYQTVPSVKDLMDKTFTVLDKNSDVSGSSLEMRAAQYAMVLFYIQDSPFFGCGYNFFNIDLGWGQGRQYLKDERLQGLEGVVMSYLLERGIVGLGLYLIFWISIIIYMFKNRKQSKPLTAFGLSILAVYLSFANMTGELLSAYPTLLLLGFCIKNIEVMKRNNIKVESNKAITI